MLNQFYAAFAPLSVGAPLRVEAVLLSLIVFLGINVAWALLFDDMPTPEHRHA